ncbi:MAG TPA: quinol:cytochrome C oxidoreductase [Candidatus Sumerlaeota bacterium]|nr:quinol:cytochrome C oxidoreductase [Candidatus Sumerlaeota bacterium]
MMRPEAQVDYRLKGSHPQLVWRVLLALAIASLVLGLVFSFAGADDSEAWRQFKFSYVTSYACYLSLSLGALFFVLIQHSCNARWSVTVRRVSEAIMMNMGLMLVLLVPILFWLPDLYHWADAEHVAHDALLQQKAPYLNIPFFLIRMGLYFVIWIGLSTYLYNRSVRQDETGDYGLTQAMRRISPVGLILFSLSLTYFAFDLLMSLDAHWYSTIFGVYYFSGAFMGALAFMILICIWVCSTGAVGRAINREHFHDLGKLMFGMVVFWAYIAFSQLLLIWMGNIPEETVWYMHRYTGTWKGFSWFLLIGHFILPFLYLLPRSVKRNQGLLGIGALWMLAMHYLDMYYLAMPSFTHENVPFNIVDPALFIGMGCLFAAAVVWRLTRRHVVPIRDPYLAESLAFENF